MRQRKTDDSVAGYFVTPGNGSIDRQYIIVIVIIKSSDGIITATEIQNIKIFDGFCFRRPDILFRSNQDTTTSGDNIDVRIQITADSRNLFLKLFQRQLRSIVAVSERICNLTAFPAQGSSVILLQIILIVMCGKGRDQDKSQHSKNKIGTDHFK